MNPDVSPDPLHPQFAARPAAAFIIDDGLHSTEANLNTAIFALSHLKPNGWLVVEDISKRSIAAWELVAATLSRAAMTCQIIKAAGPFMFVACRREPPHG